MRSSGTTQLAIGFSLWLLAGGGCSAKKDEFRRPTLVELNHDHYHVHAMDVEHEHQHEGLPLGGHQHAHQHSDESVGLRSDPANP